MGRSETPSRIVNARSRVQRCASSCRPGLLRLPAGSVTSCCSTTGTAMDSSRRVSPCTYGKPHTHGSRDRSRGRGAGERWQREHRGRALRERRRVAGVLRTFLRPPRRRARSSGGDRPWRSSGRVTMVAVVQAAHVRHRNDLARCSRLDASAHGRILAQREMRAPEMVVVDVRSQYSVE